MNNERLKILIVSSRPPEHSSNLGEDVAKALQQKDCIVDYLLLYPPLLNTDNNIYTVIDQPQKSTIDILQERLPAHLFGIVRKIFAPCRRLVRNIINSVSKKKKIAFISKKNGFYYVDESSPDICPDILLSKIPQNKKYDLIITLFWQNMLNTTSLRYLYDRFLAPIYIYSPDMAPMTGGCFYFNSCNNYKNECGNCHCILSNNRDDRSHKNYIIKKNNYSKIKAFFVGNSWMIERAIASKLFNLNTVLNISIIINENIFYPKDPLKSRQKVGIPTNFDIVLLARSTSAKRKGNDILVNAIKYLLSSLNNEYKQRLCLVSLGDNTLKNNLKGEGITVLNLGIVNRETLVDVYNSASLFLNPSTDDAGPSMVNQSIMCGTPVVSFNIGTAVDVIENNISGFKTSDVSNEGYSKILEHSVNALIKNTHPNIRKTSRDKALNHNTSTAFSNKLLNHFKEISSH